MRRGFSVRFLMGALAVSAWAVPVTVRAADEPKPAAPAQPAATAGPVAQRIKEAVAPLNLTDEQTKKVDKLIEELQKRFDEIRNSGAESAEMLVKHQAMRADGLKQMKAILTEDQFKKFEAAITQPPTQATPADRLRLALQRMQDGTKEIGLSDEQKTKVDAAFANAKKGFSDLAPQLQGDPTPELRQKLGDIFNELRTQLQTILTLEQQEKFKTTMRQSAGPGAAPTPNKEPEKKP